MHQTEEEKMERERVCRARSSPGFQQPAQREECRRGSRINQQSIINNFNITAVVLSCLESVSLNVAVSTSAVVQVSSTFAEFCFSSSGQLLKPSPKHASLGMDIADQR